MTKIYVVAVSVGDAEAPNMSALFSRGFGRRAAGGSVELRSSEEEEVEVDGDYFQDADEVGLLRSSKPLTPALRNLSQH